MNWKAESKSELREYTARRASLESTAEEICQLRAQRERLSGSSSAVPVKGGGTQWEDRQINLLVREQKLRETYALTKKWVANAERGLAVLSAEERLILDRFYINHAPGNLDRLCDELHLEKSAVYTRKDDALRHYTLARYGCVEI